MNVNTHKVSSNGQQIAIRRGQPQIKFVDVNYSVVAASTGTVLNGITNVSQGVGVSQRTGDTIYLKRLYINYSVNAANSDIFSTFRIIIFQWHPNSALVAPTVNDILQTTNLYSLYDWQFSSQYTILYDMVHSLSGTAATPCTSSNQAFFGEIGIGQAQKRAEFSPALSTGSEQFFIIVISDSAVAPFPSFNATTRLTYSEE